MPTVPLVTPQVQSSEARISLVPTPQHDVPEQKLREEPLTSTAPLKKPDDPSPTTDSSVSPVASSRTPDDGLHPTLTSDGNKFTPGTEGAAAQGPTAANGTPPTTTTSTPTPVTTADPARNDDKSGEAGTPAAA